MGCYGCIDLNDGWYKWGREVFCGIYWWIYFDYCVGVDWSWVWYYCKYFVVDCFVYVNEFRILGKSICWNLRSDWDG